MTLPLTQAIEKAIEALDRAVLFSAHRVDDPRTIRFEFANDDDRLAAANALDEAFAALTSLQSVEPPSGFAAGIEAAAKLVDDAITVVRVFGEAADNAAKADSIANVLTGVAKDIRALSPPPSARGDDPYPSKDAALADAIRQTAPSAGGEVE